MRYDSYPILVARAPSATPATFTTIAELGTIPLPELSNNEADASTQNGAIDRYVFSTLIRRKPVTLNMNFDPNDATQDHLTGLIKAQIAQTTDGYRFTHSASGLIWVASGNVTNTKPGTPFEGKLSLDVTLRFTGMMTIQGVPIGT